MAEEAIKNSDSIIISNGVTQVDSWQRDFYKRELDKKIANTANSYFDTYVGYIKSYWKYTAMTLEDCRYAALSKIYDKMPRGLVYEYNFNISVLQNLFKGTGYINPGLLGEKYQSTYSVASNLNSSTDLLNTNIPLADGTIDFNTVSQKKCNSPAYVLLNKGNTIEITDTAKFGENTSPAKALSMGALLVVEPLLIIKEMKVKGITNYEQSCLKKFYYDKFSYGSVYNIIENWHGSEVSTYVGRIDKLLPNSLVAEKDFPAKNPNYSIKGVDGNANFYNNAYKRMTEIANAMQGIHETNNIPAIALHVYDSSMFNSSSETSTYDEPNGSIPNKSEDCTSKPEESSYKTLSKSVSIIKSYETVKSDGTIQNDGYFIRENCCHTIEIEDEDKINYKVIDWQTSSENNIPYGLTESSSGGKNYTYEQLVSSCDKLQSGTSAGNTVVLTETEKILYVKLQKQEAPTVQNTRLTGDYILNESELAKAFQITPIQIQYQFPDIYMSASHSSHSYNHRPLVIGGITQKNADGSTKYTSDDCDSISTYGSDMVDNEVKVKVKNTEESNYSNIIVQSDKAKFNSQSSIEILHRNSQSIEEKTGSNTYTFSIYRYQQGEQNLVLAKYNQKQSSNKDVSVGVTQAIDSNNIDIIKTLGYQTGNTKTSKTRADVDYIVNAVKFKFIHDMANSPDNYTKSKLASKGTDCGTTIGGGEKNLAVSGISTVESEADISVQVYSGTSNKQLHTKLWTETIGRNGEKYLPIRDNNNKTVGRQVQSTSTVKFNGFM